MGLVVEEIHDVKGVQQFVSSVNVLLEHDGRESIVFFWPFWIEIMAWSGGWEGLRKNTVLHYNAVFEHELGRFGSVGAVEGSEFPIFVLDIMQNLVKLLRSKFFVKLSGAKEIVREEGLQNFASGIGCFSKVFCEKGGPFGDRDVGKDFFER